MAAATHAADNAMALERDVAPLAPSASGVTNVVESIVDACARIVSACRRRNRPYRA